MDSAHPRVRAEWFADMPSDHQIVEYALQNALQALRGGKKQAARDWAQRAITLDPDSEAAWLILAALARPRAALEYVKMALQINPGSLRARQALRDIQQHLEKNSQPRGVQLPLRSPKEKKSKKRGGWLGLASLSIMGLAAVLLLYLAISQYGSVLAHELPIGTRLPMLVQPTAASAATATAKPTDLPTSTSTDLPTVTPFPAATDTPVPTDTPIPTPTPLPTATMEPSATAAPAEAIPSGEKRIVISLSEQRLYAWQGDTLVYTFLISSGMNNETRIGTFSVLDKLPDPYSYPWGFWMPDWLGLYFVGDTEDGIHALPVMPDGSIIWAEQLGAPGPHECVILGSADAQTLYAWAEVGTQVEIIR